MGKWERQAKHESAMTALERRVLAVLLQFVMAMARAAAVDIVGQCGRR